MEDMELDPSAEYLKGFNEGYLLAETLPDLAKDLIKAIGDSDRSKGFKGGYEQYELEHDKDYQISWLKEDEFDDRDIDSRDDRDKNQDKDDYEPER